MTLRALFWFASITFASGVRMPAKSVASPVTPMNRRNAVRTALLGAGGALFVQQPVAAKEAAPAAAKKADAADDSFSLQSLGLSRKDLGLPPLPPPPPPVPTDPKQKAAFERQQKQEAAKAERAAKVRLRMCPPLTSFGLPSWGPLESDLSAVGTAG